MRATTDGEQASGVAVLFLTTFWSFVREFSSIAANAS
jgi:hypothetical protein